MPEAESVSPKRNYLRCYYSDYLGQKPTEDRPNFAGSRLLAVMRFQARGTGCGPRLARMLTACLCNVDEQTKKDTALKATSYRDGSCKHIRARAPRPIRCMY